MPEPQFSTPKVQLELRGGGPIRYRKQDSNKESPFSSTSPSLQQATTNTIVKPNLKAIYFLALPLFLCAVYLSFRDSSTIPTIPTIIPQRSWRKTQQQQLQDINLIYHHNPKQFVKTFADCLIDKEDCSIQYLHMGKSGGTYVESKMRKILGMNYTSSCCHTSMVERFREQPEYYCNARFSSYQVTPYTFKGIIKTCQNINVASNNSTTTTKKRLVTFVTYREPIQRTVSIIHQICNKNLDDRTDYEKEACARCEYEKDPDFYIGFVNMTYQVLHDIRKLANETSWRTTSSLANGDVPVELLLLDNIDMNNFFSALQLLLPVEYSKGFQETSSTDSNLEEIENCNFRMPSKMMKAIGGASREYRDLSLGSLL